MPGSHNVDRPSHRDATAEEYSAFYGRIEKAFNPKDMTKENLAEWLGSETHSLLDQLALVGELYRSIEKTDNLDDLQLLEDSILAVPVYEDKLLDKLRDKEKEIKISLREKQLAKEITELQSFAKEKGISLNERTRGGIYQKWGRNKAPALVIFKNGKIKSWRYVR